MDGSEIGLVVALATDFRNEMEAAGCPLSDPIVYASLDPGFTFGLSKQVVRLQKAGCFQDAAALMVWVHTMRAASRLELRQLGRELWTELARGFPHVVDGARIVKKFQSRSVDVRNADAFPKGFSPVPQ
jgi:hypothetical protein